MFRPYFSAYYTHNTQGKRIHEWLKEQQIK